MWEPQHLIRVKKRYHNPSQLRMESEVVCFHWKPAWWSWKYKDQYCCCYPWLCIPSQDDTALSKSQQCPDSSTDVSSFSVQVISFFLHCVCITINFYEISHKQQIDDIVYVCTQTIKLLFREFPISQYGCEGFIDVCHDGELSEMVDDAALFICLRNREICQPYLLKGIERWLNSHQAVEGGANSASYCSHAAHATTAELLGPFLLRLASELL